jgi:hypothetical protein
MRRTMTQILVCTVMGLGVISPLALAEEMTCSKDNGTQCILAKDAQKNQVEVLVPAVKAGDKLICTESNGVMRCQKDTRKPQEDAMK